MKQQGKIYYPHLNGLRFLAFLLVFIHHAEQFKSLFLLPNRWHLPFVAGAGAVGVHLFFVLSGFLITSILLEEERLCGRISIGHFYIRRILRIWPLYFFVLVIGFLLHPTAIHLLPYFVFFLSNVALILFPPLPSLAPTWSISTEEQFYLLWPFIMQISKSRGRLFFGVVLLHFILSLGTALARFNGWHHPVLTFLSDFLIYFAIDYLAAGAWFAWLFKTKPLATSSILTRPAQIGAAFFLIFCLFSGFAIPFFQRVAEACCFGLLIINFAAHPKPFLNLEHPALNYLGKISYGLYLFHSLCLITLFQVVAKIGRDAPVDALVYAGGLALTIFVAAASYHLFEKRFLRKKTSFSAVPSG